MKSLSCAGRFRTPPRARSLRLGILIVIVVTVSSGCHGRDTHALIHDPIAAAAAAEEFARVAFVERNADKAYTLVWEEWKKELSFGMLIVTMKQVHPSGSPAQVRAIEYEPIPDKPAIAIFLNGENDAGEKFYYRFVMAGSAAAGYKVGGFLRGTGPYPKSSTRRALQSGLAMHRDRPARECQAVRGQSS